MEISVGKKQEKHKDEWEVKNAARTLMEAKEIKSDEKLMAAVKIELQKQKKAAIESLEDLKAYANNYKDDDYKEEYKKDNDMDEEES